MNINKIEIEKIKGMKTSIILKSGIAYYGQLIEVEDTFLILLNKKYGLTRVLYENILAFTEVEEC